MTYEMEYAARLFSCGAQGIPAPAPERPVDWEKVVRIAVEQSVTYTVALAMKNNDLGCPPDIRERLTASQRGAAVKNYFKTRRILEIVGEMENSGVPVIIIKGIDAAAAYASPECRVSADTDLLVRPGDEEKALLLLRKRGFETDTRKKHDADTMCSHPELGLLELHISLMVESHMNEFPGCDRLGESLRGKRHAGV